MLHKGTIQGKPSLSKRAFWDIDLHSLDFSRHAKFIITRVFERGSEEDKQVILNYYGREKIIQVLKSANSLMPIARERAKQLFHLSDQDFACYTSKRSGRNLSRY